MDKLSGIYQIKNIVNGHRYVGSSVDIQHRWCMHRRRLQKGVHCNSYLQHAWDKYGEENFSFAVLLLCPEDDTTKFEQAYLDRGTCEYNIATDATAPMLGKTFTEEHRQNLSEALTGRHHSAKTRAKIGAQSKGRIPNNETREKMSKAHSGINNHFYGRHHTKEAKQKIGEASKGRKITGYWKGKTLSEETKRKIGEAQKGEKHWSYGKEFTEEHKQKMSDNHADVSGKNNPMYGKEFTEEHRRKISEGVRRHNRGKKQ